MYSLQHNRDEWIFHDANDRSNIVGDFFYNLVGRQNMHGAKLTIRRFGHEQS